MPLLYICLPDEVTLASTPLTRIECGPQFLVGVGLAYCGPGLAHFLQKPSSKKPPLPTESHQNSPLPL